MDFEIGDYVTRNSYDNDIVFVITEIIDSVYYLKGRNVRLCADSPLDDLKKYEKKDTNLEEEEYLKRIKQVKTLDREDYFYLPGKILHIDKDNYLSNLLLILYKIRENIENDTNEKFQKRHKIGNFS